MKICYICFNTYGQGTYWRAFHFGRILAGMGHEVTVLSTSPTARSGIIERMESGVRVVQTPDLFLGPLRSGWDPWNILNRIVWLRDRHFDLVHAFETRPTVIYPALSLQRRGVPLFTDWCDWFGKGGSVEERPNPFVRTILRPVETYYEENFRLGTCGTTVICTTLFEKARKLGISKESILLVRNGVDLDLFQPPMNTETRMKYGLSKEQFVVGFLGSLFSRDAGLMIEGFRKASSINPEMRLVLINFKCPQKLVLGALGQKILTLSAASEKEIVQILDACDTFWLPFTDCRANWGRFPIKLGIYAAMGKPIISTRVGDSAQLISQCNIGKISDPTAIGLANATLELAASVEAQKSLSFQSRSCAEENFSWIKNGSSLEIFYRQVLKND